MITSLAVNSDLPNSGIPGHIRLPVKSSAVASLEYIPFNQKKGNGLLMVGTIDGYFKSWKICAYEAEEEEETVHVDEEETNVKLKFTKYFTRSIFRSTLSLISCSSEEKKMFFVALGSLLDEKIFVLKIPSDFNSTATLRFAVSLQTSPSSCIWIAKTFWMGCNNGNLSSFTPSRGQKEENNECFPHASWETSIPSITNMCTGNKGEFLVVSGTANEALKIFSVQSESVSTTLSSGMTEDPLKFRNPSKLSTPHSDMVVCMTSSLSGVFIAAGCVDGSVHIWNIVSGEVRLAARAYLHKQPVLSVTFSVDSSVVMSCGSDGSVFLATVNTPTRVTYKAALGDSKFYEKVSLIEEPFGTGSGSNSASSSYKSELAMTSVDPSSSMTWFENKKADALEELKKKSAGKVGEVLNSVEDISNRLRHIMDRNDGRQEDIEKLQRDEMVINLDGKEEILLENEKDVANTRTSFYKRNLWNEMIASRVRESCWECMESHERLILPFNSDDKTVLASFSIRNRNDDEKRKLDVIKRMRGIEIRTQRIHSQGLTQRLPSYESSVRTCWAKSILGFSTAVSWIANDGSRWPAHSVVASLLRKEKGDDFHDGKKEKDKDKDKEKDKERDSSSVFGHSGVPEGPSNAESGAVSNTRFGVEDEDEVSTTSIFETDREMDETNIFNLLYSPETVRTHTQKRSQIILLTEVSRLLRSNFNSFFEELSMEKEDVILSIETRNTRLKVILDELKQVETLFEPKLTDPELKDSAVTITDFELISRPYESELSKIARMKEEERKKHLADNESENLRGRALLEMMHGTLEVKRDAFFDISALLKPSWMDELLPSEMTESQLKEFEIFENKLKTLQEDQLKYRKSLEQEMKKIKSETAEACKNFDEKVGNVARIKVLVQREILTQELYIARLGLSVVKRDQAWNSLKKTELKIDDVRKERGDLRIRIEKFNQYVESVKASLSAIQEEERGLDKSFKRDFQTVCNNNFDQDALKIFADLFRRREYAVSPDDDDEGSQDLDAEESDMLVSGSLRGSSRKSKAQSSKASRRNNNGNSKRAKGLSTSKKNAGLGGSKKGGVGASSRMMKASRGGNGRSINAGKERLGPMQEAAQALKTAQAPEANEKDPFFIDLLQRAKQVRLSESKIPLLMGLNIDSDCPENFVVDQYTWSKLQDLRNIRIEKEIQGKRMAIDYSELKRKLDDLISEEGVLVGVIGSLRQIRDETISALESMEINLELLVYLKQGQDEVDKDAVVTDYEESVLVPTSVVDKYNVRIKDLGKEKVGVLSRIKQYRKKINLTEWNSLHLAMETRHMEEFFTDLQLLRVTRELQQVIRDGSNTEQTKVNKWKKRRKKEKKRKEKKRKEKKRKEKKRKEKKEKDNKML